MAKIQDFDVWFVSFPYHPARLLGEEGENIEPLVSDDFSVLQALGLKRSKGKGSTPNQVAVDYTIPPPEGVYTFYYYSFIRMDDPTHFFIYQNIDKDGDREPHYFFFSTEQDARAWVDAWRQSKGLEGLQMYPLSHERNQREEELVRLFKSIRARSSAT